MVRSPSNVVLNYCKVLEFDENLLIKNIQGRCSEEESEQVNHWLTDSPENMETYTRLKVLCQAYKMESFQADESYLHEINDRIDAIRKKGRRHTLTVFARYAAAFVGLLVVGLMYFVVTKEKPVMLSQSVPPDGNVVMVVLEDGSKVHLNSGTVLTYPEAFSNRRRVVELNGEAFFEVMKDASKPFIVETDALTVEVTGTSFNVKTNAEENTIETVLVTGSVTLFEKPAGTAHKPGTTNKVGTLKPGQMAITNRTTGTTTIREVDVNAYTSWQEGLISLQKASLTEIISKIEQVYHVELAYDSVKLSKQKKRYNFVFRKNQDIKTVLEMLKYIAPQTKEVKLTEK